MGSKYPVLKSSEITKVLEQFGFAFISQKGSHAKYVRQKNPRRIAAGKNITYSVFQFFITVSF